ncbi:MAG: tetratricopeptide repeat protein, partial [Candidatus Krumholzibacteria bacterium]|jgi:lipopolysaccharide biosynthesis regulator YciM|nr:tetratricopeptide repeat protein [Candidatus Krumholzibacteria bacterium]
LQLAVQSGQGGVDAFLRLGDLYRSQGQFKKAIHIHRSLEIRRDAHDQDRARILASLADDYLAANRWDEALGQLEELRRLDSRDPSIARRMSQVFLHKMELEKAQAELRKAHRLEGEDQTDEMAILLTEGARQKIHDQQWKEGRKALQEALKLNPACIPALRLSADLFHQEGKDQEAADEIQTMALTATQGSEHDYPKMEKLFFDLGRFHEIQFVYQEVLSKDPGFWPARFALAAILDKRGSREDAIRLLDSNLNSHSIDAVKASRILLEWDKPELAMQWLEKWNSSGPLPSLYRCRNCGSRHSGPRWYCPACHGFNSYDPITQESADHIPV